MGYENDSSESSITLGQFMFPLKASSNEEIAVIYGRRSVVNLAQETLDKQTRMKESPSPSCQVQVQP